MRKNTLELTDRQIAILIHALRDAEDACYSDLIKRDRKELLSTIEESVNE